VKKVNYENVWTWNAGKKFSPSRQLFTHVTVAHEIDHFQINFSIFRKSKELIYESSLRIDSSQEPVLTDVLGQLKWSDEAQVSIFSASEPRNQVAFSGW
jgi:hypothetical protein